MSFLTYWYGFIKPEYHSFEDNTKIQAVVIGTPGAARSVFVSLKTDMIPDIPVTISFIIDDVVVAHRHYASGIPTAKGNKFAEGEASFIEPVPLLFTINSPKLTVKFSFKGVKTLGAAEVFTFNTELIDGNPKQNKENSNVLQDGGKRNELYV